MTKWFYFLYWYFFFLGLLVSKVMILLMKMLQEGSRVVFLFICLPTKSLLSKLESRMKQNRTPPSPQELSLTNGRNRARNWNLIFEALYESKKMYRRVFDRLLPFHCPRFQSFLVWSWEKAALLFFPLMCTFVPDRFHWCQPGLTSQALCV